MDKVLEIVGDGVHGAADLRAEALAAEGASGPTCPELSIAVSLREDNLVVEFGGR